MDPDEVQRRRAERKERQRRRRRANSIQGSNTIGRQNCKNVDEKITSGNCDLADSPLRSLIASPNIQAEDEYHSPTSSTKRLMYNKPCQIDTNDLSLEEPEAQKSLLNKTTSQVGGDCNYRDIFTPHILSCLKDGITNLLSINS